jgi:hypothetical protein
MSVIKANLWQNASGVTLSRPLQVKHTLFTNTLSIGGAGNFRMPLAGFFVDIKPIHRNSNILVICSLAVGFTSTPEWSWFVDRTTGAGNGERGVSTQVGTIGNNTYVEGRMNGYHGGPRDGNAGADGDGNWGSEIESFYHSFIDSPATTEMCRYQVCIQDRWSNGNPIFLNRCGNDADNYGYMTRGTSSITVMEIPQ